MAEILLHKVTKRFPGGFEAVKDLSLTVRDGEFFILVGPSGCGKTTVLHMIAGLAELSEGELRVDGRLLNAVDPKDRNMAMVFQGYALYPHLTVFENLAFPLRLRRLPEAELGRRVEAAAATLQLSELLERRPAQLSGGQRQRVAMGRAIVREPAAFLMDEPLSNLDAQLRVQMRIELARLQKTLGITTIYVTHDQGEAMTLGDRIGVLHQGVLQQVGTPRELYEEPATLFVAGFIGSPAMNFLPARLEGRRLVLPMTALELPPGRLPRSVPEGRSLVAGIRPEGLSEARPGPGPAGPGFRAVPELVEWMGSEVHAYFEVPGASPGPPGPPARAQGPETPYGGPTRLVARLDPASPVAPGRELELRIDPARLHLFDPTTGARLSGGR